MKPPSFQITQTIFAAESHSSFYVGAVHAVYSFPKKKKKKALLYSRYYAKACDEWQGPYPRLSAWATQLRRTFAAVVSGWRHCADLAGVRPLAPLAVSQTTAQNCRIYLFPAYAKYNWFKFI